jgi:ABC-type glycerol-3-phosphate transport system permease component
MIVTHPFQRLLRIGLILVVGAVVGLPFYWLLISALKTPVEVVAYPPTWFPKEFRWQNIPDALALLSTTAIVNSVVFSVSVTILQLSLVVPTGFALAKIPFPGRHALLWMFIITFFVPFQVLLIPTFLIVRDLGWIDTWQGLVLPIVAQTSFGVFVFRQFYVDLPDELLEAARMDGAHLGQIFLRIVVPLSLPAIAAYVSVTVLTAWNMFIWPLVATTDLNLRVLPISLSALVTQRAQITPNLAMMAVLISTLPIIAIFIPLQRYFVSGLVGAVKE